MVKMTDRCSCHCEFAYYKCIIINKSIKSVIEGYRGMGVSNCTCIR